jgi:hypothetical protein
MSKSFVRKRNTVLGGACAIQIIWALVVVSIWVAAGIVAYHFASKYW